MDEPDKYKIYKELIRQTMKVLFTYEIQSSSFTDLSPTFSHLWQRTRESILAHPALILDTVHPDDKDYLAKEYHELLSGVIKYDIEFRITLPDESVAWMLLNPKLIKDHQGRQIIAGIIEDITLAKENISNLQKFAAKKNSILEILSHDLAGPIANIQGLAHLLSDYTEEYKNKEIDEVIRIIRESSEKSILMIREFVQQEFLSSANTGVVKRRVNLVEKMGEIMEQYKNGEELIKKQFQFTSSTDKLFMYLDHNKFQQVINNLISNSIKFTHDEGVIHLDISEKGNSVLIMVKDNGIGIPECYHDDLFDRFTSARRQGLKGSLPRGSA